MTFPPDGQTDIQIARRTDISVYRVASLLKTHLQNKNKMIIIDRGGLSASLSKHGTTTHFKIERRKRTKYQF